MRGRSCRQAARPIPTSRFQSWSVTELIAQAEKLGAEGAPEIASALYKNWIACNPANPWLHAAYFNYSVSLAKAGDRLGAINAARESIRIKPDFQPPYINLGRMLEDARQVAEAVTQWKALTENLREVTGEAIRNKLLALEQIARVLEANNLDGPAEDILRQSLDISVSQSGVLQHWIALRQRQCKWPVVVGWDAVKTKSLMAGISPLSLASLSNDPLYQLGRAHIYSRGFIGRVPDPISTAYTARATSSGSCGSATSPRTSASMRWVSR